MRQTLVAIVTEQEHNWGRLLFHLVYLCSRLTLATSSTLRSPHLREDTAETAKVPGRAEQMDLGEGVTFTPRKMKSCILKGA